jgi:hypothetical protein
MAALQDLGLAARAAPVVSLPATGCRKPSVLAGEGVHGRGGSAMARVRRQTVDLSGYPDLVVIYLGMRANSLRGLRTLISFGPRITRAAAAKPDGLLYHQGFLLQRCNSRL